MPEDTILVSWYEHDCPWNTKYCDEYHRVYARVPKHIAKQYRTTLDTSGDQS